ncbi:hypothetical protein FYK55_27185 [Roseiconus nitratireducens]|uniref:Uncharacterized protein n=1 Tax=Roseiconus nitratireducens TaxID=2605748 RepID=A0A5M6D0A5_9BACT|nr:hypothetical protein [Roseiconus nitratireducens]KAA5538575.1 hypothetical protein FYK55_27185 [Roseiconus nitratireducens]
MLLRAQAFGKDPFRRFLILRIDDRKLWDGESFTDEFDSARKFHTPSDACFAIQDILKEHYKDLPQRHYVVPVEISVQGNVTEKEIAEYLFRASVLSIRTEEFGNGPKDSYVAPIIHWGYLKATDGPVNKDSENPVNWGLDQDDS